MTASLATVRGLLKLQDISVFQYDSPGGGMVDAVVLEATIERCRSSSLLWGTMYLMRGSVHSGAMPTVPTLKQQQSSYAKTVT